MRNLVGFFGMRMPSFPEDKTDNEWISRVSPGWKTENWNESYAVVGTESVSEKIAGWIGLTLPKRVTVIQDLDPSTVFVLEVCKFIRSRVDWIVCTVGSGVYDCTGSLGTKSVPQIAVQGSTSSF